MNTPAKHYVYQRVHTLKGRALRLDDHIRFASRAYEHIYGVSPAIDPKALADNIARTLRANHAAATTGALVMLCFFEAEEGGHTFTVDYERPLLEAGYYHSALRPRAVSYEYGLPFGGFPTNFQVEAQALYDTLARRQHGAARSVRRRGEVLLSCGDAPLFAIRGRVLYTAPLTEGAMDGVEREMVIAAAAKARLTVREEPILHTELKSFEELLLADAAGLTSLAECDGAQFMTLVAPRLAAAMSL